MNQLTLAECSKRKLDEIYLVVYAIKNEINIKKGDYIEKSDVYTLIGIDIKGVGKRDGSLFHFLKLSTKLLKLMIL